MCRGRAGTCRCHRRHRRTARLPVTERLARQLQGLVLADPAGDHQQRAIRTEAAGVFGAQVGRRDRIDGGLGLLDARVGMVAVDRLGQCTLGTEVRLRLGGLQRLQLVGLGQRDLVLGERGVARHLGQQLHHRRGLRGDGIRHHPHAIHRHAATDTATHALRHLGDGARVVLFRAFVEHVGQGAGEARPVGRVRRVTGVADRQHVVHARHAVARQHPHLQPVLQRGLLDLRHRQRLVRGVRGQVLGQHQFALVLGDAGGRDRQRHGHRDDRRLEVHGRLLSACRRRARPASRPACDR